MRIQLRVLPLAALMMASVSAFAAYDPFDAELFLSPLRGGVAAGHERGGVMGPR
jgi:hypothetical protein